MSATYASCIRYLEVMPYNKDGIGYLVAPGAMAPLVAATRGYLFVNDPVLNGIPNRQKRRSESWTIASDSSG